MAKDKKADELTECIKQLKPYLLLGLLLSVFVGILSLTPIVYMREVYGPVVMARSEQTLAWVTLLLLVALAMSGVVEWVRQRIQSAASVKLALVLGRRVFEASFRANLANLPGARVALADFRVIRNFIASPTAGVLMDAPIGFMLIGLIFYVHPVMGLLSTVGALLTLLISWLTERSVRPIMTEAIERNQVATAYASDAARNAETILAMGMQPALRERWQLIQNEYLKKQAGATNLQAFGSSTTKMVMLIQGSAVLGVGTMLTLLGVLSPQQGALLIVAKFIGAIAMRPMMQLITQWKQVVTARDAYDRLKLFMAKLPERMPNMPLPPPRGFLEVKGLSTVAPGGSELILRDVTFAVQPGRVLAVIGPSGSGKSSLARMLTGIWGPRQGEVRLDGVSVSQWDKGELGPFVGYLPQDVALFDGSIAENVSRFGDPDALELARVLNATGLADWIGALPEGPETQLGEEGLRLSGGQRQRLGLARAMYGQPQLLVLDEPNSSLDEEGDRALASAILNERARGATIVLITHRPELLAVSDLILVLKEGRPQMFGPRDQVVARLNGTDASK